MNKARRKQLADIADQLEELKDRLVLLEEEEQDAFDNLPEGLQQAEKGQAMELAAQQIATAADAVTEAIEALVDAQV